MADMPVYSPGNIRFFDLMDGRTGRLRRIFLSVPPGVAPKTGWPALVMFDGNAMIAMSADIMRSQAPYPSSTNLGWGVLIGMGYPTEEAYDFQQRSWDLTPPPGRLYPPFFPGNPEARTGGADEFARFLLQDALPTISALVPINKAETSIFGHSFGGLFTLWLLFTQASSFRHWIAASPSITWEDGNLLRFFDAFDASIVRGDVHVSAGEWEGDRIAPFQLAGAEREKRLKAAAKEQTVSAARDLVARLEKTLGNRVSFEIIADATHMSVLPTVVNRALHLAFGLWRGTQLSG